jgi:hypothetical protein
LVFEDTGGFLLSKLCESETLDIAASLAIRIEIATTLAEAHDRTSSLAVSILQPFWPSQGAGAHG